MSDQTLIILRICLLALVYLTFFRVLRAVWVELRAEAPRAPVDPLAAPVPVAAGSAATAPPAPQPAPVPAVAAAPPRLMIVAPSHVAGTSYELVGETTIGRAGGCAVVIDDARVSKLHARVFFAAGRWVVEDLDSTNGTLLNGESVTAAQPVRAGDRVQIGDVVMELS